MDSELEEKQEVGEGCCKEGGKKRDGNYQLNMLAQENRLKKKKEFERVFEKGQGFKEGFLLFKVVKNDLDTVRFGFVVSKNFSKKAVLRNKTKRRLRQLIKNKIPELKERGFDAVLIVLKGLEKRSFLETDKNIDSIFKKAKIF